MRAAHEVAQVREAERALMATLPPGALMQRAAAGLAAVCAGRLRQVYGARVVVLAGSGDNGGDALYAGARLARRGAAVLAVAAGPRLHEQGAAALRAAGGRVTPPDDPALPAALGRADLVLDGLLGIGGRGGLRGPYAELAALARAARQRGGGAPMAVAVDLPSGIDADTGVVAGEAFRADVTVTFGTVKPGLLIDPGASYAGRLEFVDIGLEPYLPGVPVAAPEVGDVAALLPPPPPESDKYRRGVVGVLAGSGRFTGAAALAVGAAVRGGAGMVRLVSASAAARVVRERWPEAVITVTGEDAPAGEEVGAAGRVQAWVAGPGMGTDADARRRLAAVLATDLPVLVDADGLTLLSQERGLLSRSAPTLLTPHAGELSRLLGVDAAEVAERRLEHARAAAAEFGVTVLLKGSTTVVASAAQRGVPEAGWDIPVLVNPTGTSWLATAGTGDVLSGLAGALLAQGLTARQAGVCAAFLHGLAARQAAAGSTASAAPGAARGAGVDGSGAGAARGVGVDGSGAGVVRGVDVDGSGAGVARGRVRLAGVAAGRQAGDAPIGAGDVLRALPGAFRTVRRARQPGAGR